MFFVSIYGMLATGWQSVFSHTQYHLSQLYDMLAKRLESELEVLAEGKIESSNQWTEPCGCRYSRMPVLKNRSIKD
jgi:hypothetical protein